MEWHKDILEWREGNTLYQSIVFSWDLPKAMYRITNPQFREEHFVVGGPAVKLNPEYLKDVAEIKADMPGMLQRHNPEATRTSTGCVRKCSFCAVPQAEGKLVELEDWPVLPVICDNNLLACSKKHFDGVIKKLKTLAWCDFNQGLDARLLTQYHADRLSELHRPIIRLAWDNVEDENKVIEALSKLTKAGISKSRIGCYVLIGFNDTPEDALYRLRTLRELKIMPFPMRYQPLGVLKRNDYVAENWIHKELVRYMRYWSNLRFTSRVPFEEFEQTDTRSGDYG